MCLKCDLKVGDDTTSHPDDNNRYSGIYVKELMDKIESLEEEIDDLKHEIYFLHRG